MSSTSTLCRFCKWVQSRLQRDKAKVLNLPSRSRHLGFAPVEQLYFHRNAHHKVQKGETGGGRDEGGGLLVNF